jgi:hypothetical protein
VYCGSHESDRADGGRAKTDNKGKGKSTEEAEEDEEEEDDEDEDEELIVRGPRKRKVVDYSSVSDVPRSPGAGRRSKATSAYT